MNAEPPASAQPLPAVGASGRRAALQRFTAVALGYAVLGHLAFASGHGSALLWWPTGLAVAAALRWGPRCALAVLGGTLLLALAPSMHAATVVGRGVGDALAAVGAGWLLGRLGFDQHLSRRSDVGWLVAAAAAAAWPAALADLAIAAALGGVGAGPWAAVPDVVGRTLATLLVAVPVLAGTREAWRVAFGPLRAPVHGTLLVGFAVAVGLFATATAATATAWAAAAAALLVLIGIVGGVAVASAAALAAGLAGAALGAATSADPGAAAVWPQAWGFVAVLGAAPLLTHLLTKDLVGIERRWIAALGGAGLGVAEWRSGNDEGRTSARWKALTGEESTSLRRWLLRVHDDDRPELQQALDRLAEGGLSRAQREIRVRDNGGWRWLDLQMLVTERDRHGAAARLIATLSDSSERHEAQERQRLSTSLFEHVHEGLLIADADLRVLDVNPAYTRILGVPREELIGTVPPMLRPAPADPLVRQQRLLMWSALRATGRWRGEIVERRRDGLSCTLQVTISLVHDESGRVRHHVLVISDVTEQRQQRDRLERQAHFDELTRLPNRTRMMELLAQGMRSADAEGHLMTVAYLDLDRFKPVNDRFGHAAGDRLLVELAGRLRSALRSSEFWSDAAGRIGGDEFLLLLRASTMDEARLAVERVLRVVAQPYVIDPATDAVQITASIGATVYPLDRSDADTLLRHADHAMYGAKQAGRNGARFFDPEHRRRTEERVMAIGRVQEALDNREFVLHYQPKVDMRSGTVLGLEALLRWDHPQQGLVAPMQFLPLIENTGLSSRIGDWVLGHALEHLAGWRRAGLDLSVSVNVSARHLQEPDFALRLAELLARHPEPLAAALELEVLETAAHADIQATSALLGRCRALGVRFALDDFGTGYSTLTYLKQLPVDVLKIDRSFVQHMLDDAQDRAIVEGVIGLARTFECTVVAEGVESPAQARTLLEMGCHIGQGTGIAAPMPPSAVAAWVRDYRGLFTLSPAAPPAAARAGGSGAE